MPSPDNGRADLAGWLTVTAVRADFHAYKGSETRSALALGTRSSSRIRAPQTLDKNHALMPAVTPLHPGPARYRGGLAEVGPGVHAWLQPNGLLGESNAALVVGDGASLLIDTLWDPRLTRRMLAAMAPLIRAAPIETLVNTHSDGDHWWGNQEVKGAEIIATEAAAAVMEDESPAEMKRFGALAGALRLAGSLRFPYPRRGDIAAIAAYTGAALAPFAFDEVRLVSPTRTPGEARPRGRRPRGSPDRGRPRAHPGRPDRLGAGRPDRDRGRHPLHRRHPDHVGGAARALGGGARAPARARRRAIRARARPGLRSRQRCGN